MTVKNTCENCLHVKKVKADLKTTLQCKRYPPSVFNIPTQDNFQRIAIQSFTIWPQVADSDTCSEFSGIIDL